MAVAVTFIFLRRFVFLLRSRGTHSIFSYKTNRWETPSIPYNPLPYSQLHFLISSRFYFIFLSLFFFFEQHHQSRKLKSAFVRMESVHKVRPSKTKTIRTTKTLENERNKFVLSKYSIVLTPVHVVVFNVLLYFDICTRTPSVLASIRPWSSDTFLHSSLGF